VRQFLKCSTLRAASSGLFLLTGFWPRRCGGADSGRGSRQRAAEYRQRQASGADAGAGVGPGFRQRAELRFRVDDALDDAQQIEGAAREAVNPLHCHHVTGEWRAELLKLAIEGLPAGANAGIPDEAFFGMTFGHILRQT